MAKDNNQNVITAIGPDFYFATVNIGKPAKGIMYLTLCRQTNSEKTWEPVSENKVDFENMEVVAKTVDYKFQEGTYKCEIKCEVKESDGVSIIVGESKIVNR